MPPGEFRLPAKQLGAIGSSQDFSERIALVGSLGARGDGEQMQIVVAEYHDGRRSQRLDEAQRIERPRSAIDEVADEPRTIAGGVEGKTIEQELELCAAALNVTNCVDCHDKVSD